MDCPSILPYLFTYHAFRQLKDPCKCWLWQIIFKPRHCNKDLNSFTGANPISPSIVAVSKARHDWGQAPKDKEKCSSFVVWFVRSFCCSLNPIVSMTENIPGYSSEIDYCFNERISTLNLIKFFTFLLHFVHLWSFRLCQNL